MTEEINLEGDRSKDSAERLTANITVLLGELKDLQQETWRNAMRFETLINQIGFEVGYLKGKAGMTEEKRIINRKKMRKEWAEWISGKLKPKNEPGNTTLDFVRDENIPIRYKLETLAKCIDILDKDVYPGDD